MAVGSLLLFGKSDRQHRREARRWRNCRLVRTKQALRANFSRELLVSQYGKNAALPKLHDSLDRIFY